MRCLTIGSLQRRCQQGNRLFSAVLVLIGIAIPQRTAIAAAGSCGFSVSLRSTRSRNEHESCDAHARGSVQLLSIVRLRRSRAVRKLARYATEPPNWPLSTCDHAARRCAAGDAHLRMRANTASLSRHSIRNGRGAEVLRSFRRMARLEGVSWSRRSTTAASACLRRRHCAASKSISSVGAREDCAAVIDFLKTRLPAASLYWVGPGTPLESGASGPQGTR